LKSRLTQFYREYAETILTYEWIRLFMFAGLKDLGLNDRYLKMLRERVFEKVIVEIRAEYGRPPIAQLPITVLEIEMVWVFTRRFSTWEFASTSTGCLWKQT
jgi:hypothetical protein